MNKPIQNESEAITQWIDLLCGELDPEQEGSLHAYLEAHPDLRSDLFKDRQIWERLNELPSPGPSAAMDARFEAMLAGYKAADRRQQLPDVLNYFQNWFDRSWKMGMAYLIAGLLLGWYFMPSNNQSNEISGLHEEIRDMKKMMMLTLIEQPRAQQRIRAVSMAGELSGADSRVIEVLGKTLNEDSNVNVRLAALESLMAYWDLPEARSTMVRSISNQKSPLVQTAIADAMLALREKDAIDPFMELLQQPELDQGVKEKLETTISKLTEI